MLCCSDDYIKTEKTNGKELPEIILGVLEHAMRGDRRDFEIKKVGKTYQARFYIQIKRSKYKRTIQVKGYQKYLGSGCGLHFDKYSLHIEAKVDEERTRRIFKTFIKNLEKDLGTSFTCVQ